jgi:hypothetical protein
MWRITARKASPVPQEPLAREHGRDVTAESALTWPLQGLHAANKCQRLAESLYIFLN